MTQAGGNGHKPDADHNSDTTYKPVYFLDTDEIVGWEESDSEDKDGKFLTELPPELHEEFDPPEN